MSSRTRSECSHESGSCAKLRGPELELRFSIIYSGGDRMHMISLLESASRNSPNRVSR